MFRNGHSAKAVGERWKKLIADGKWELREDCFWAQPRPLWEMPTRVRKVCEPPLLASAAAKYQGGEGFGGGGAMNQEIDARSSRSIHYPGHGSVPAACRR